MSEEKTGSGPEMGPKTTTPQKTTAVLQNHPPPTYAEWAAAMQAYYGAGPHVPYPPYMWALAMYPPTPGIYGQMPSGAHPYSGPYGNVHVRNLNDIDRGNATKVDGDDGKSGNGILSTESTKKSNVLGLGSLGKISCKHDEEVGKGTNTTLSNSHDNGSEDSTKGSDETTPAYDSDACHKGTFNLVSSKVVNSMSSYGEVNHGTIPMLSMMIAGNQVIAPRPLMNLNIGMDGWNKVTPIIFTSNPRKHSLVGSSIIPSSVGRPNRDGDLWLQDERELKRQRRKQSNRESARRSRLRKQAECEELASQVEALVNENTTLRSEITHITKQYNTLLAKKSSLMERLQMRHISPTHMDEELQKTQQRKEIQEDLQMDANRDHPKRNADEGNDTFIISSDGGNLTVSTSSS